jgi:hypothetical protein
MTHDLESGRGWTRLTTGAQLVRHDRRTIYRWIAAGWVRRQKFRGHAFVNLADLMETERAIASGDTPGMHCPPDGGQE